LHLIPVWLTGFDQNRVYYISTDGKLKERGYDGASWFDGGLNGQFEIAANSKLASCFFAASDDSYVRVYAQLADGSIQEFGFNGTKLRDIGVSNR
jgi:hypothetical protein